MHDLVQKMIIKNASYTGCFQYNEFVYHFRVDDCIILCVIQNRSAQP
jgi:hypothetical protein